MEKRIPINYRPVWRYTKHPLQARTRALGDLGARVVLGPLEHPSSLVVDDEGGYGVNCSLSKQA